MKLAFDAQKFVLENVNARSELHGDEREPACDLKLACDVSNDILSELHPALKGLLYYFDDARPADLVDQGKKHEAGYLPHLRLGSLVPPLKWGEEMLGVTVELDCAGKKVVLSECKANNVAFEPRDGGTVHLALRVQGHPDATQFGLLCTWVQSEVMVTMNEGE